MAPSNLGLEARTLALKHKKSAFSMRVFRSNQNKLEEIWGKEGTRQHAGCSGRDSNAWLPKIKEQPPSSCNSPSAMFSPACSNAVRGSWQCLQAEELRIGSSQALGLSAMAAALRRGRERKPLRAPGRSSRPKFSLLDNSTLPLSLMDALTHFLTPASVVGFRGH